MVNSKAYCPKHRRISFLLNRADVPTSPEMLYRTGISSGARILDEFVVGAMQSSYHAGKKHIFKLRSSFRDRNRPAVRPKIERDQVYPKRYRILEPELVRV